VWGLVLSFIATKSQGDFFFLMNSLLIYCLVYIAALLSTACLGFPLQSQSSILALMLASIWFVTSAGFAALFPRYWKQGLISGVVAVAAVGYLYISIPRPGIIDISHLLDNQNQVPVQVTGISQSWLKTSTSGRKSLWLKVTGLGRVNGPESGVNGNIYVSMKPEKAIPVHPGQVLRLQGLLRKPGKTEDGFDFAEYLAKKNTFASLGVRTIEEVGNVGFFYQFQQRVMDANAVVGSPNAEIISGFAIGNKPVDIPRNISDQFAAAGLSHALAASGTQVSLLLFAVLALTKRLGKWVQIGAGVVSVSILVILCSPSPSIVRAALMGAVSLLALSQGSRKKSLSALVGVATIMLLHNPCQIWDLGFDFSFLATLGLIVTGSKLQKALDFIPPAIAAAIAVPVAATLWTMPVQMLVFKEISLYGILANLVTEPLVWLLSLGSIAGAFVSLISPAIGSLFAIALSPICSLLLWLVDVISHLPGAVMKLEEFSLIGFIAMYLLLGASHFDIKRWHFWLLAFAGTVLISAIA